MKPEIRRAQHQDAAHIINAHKRSIRELCYKDYSPEQIAVWSGRNFQEERWHQTMDKDFVWVISDPQNNIFGFGHLQFHGDLNAEIAGLYFVPEVVGAGLGKKIVQLMFDECRTRKVQVINLSATKTAKAFYENVGFKQIGPPGEISIGGKKLECYKMQKSLV